MPHPKRTRDLARGLVAREAESSTTSLQTEPASVRVYERLRRQLRSSVGTDGFQSLASRALALAKSESPRLGAVQVMADGALRGLGGVDTQTNADEEREAGTLLIAQLLGVFVSLLGEETTLRLIEDLRIQAEVEARAVTASVKMLDSVSEEPTLAAGFEELLLEIDRLRKVSDRIEALTDKHPDMGEGLLSIARNIRSMATVLDVFTLIRSKAGGSQEVAALPKTNGYLN